VAKRDNATDKNVGNAESARGKARAIAESIRKESQFDAEKAGKVT
jgi:hypothetical protein